MPQITFEQDAFNEFIEWEAKDHKKFNKITRLISEIARTPFTGTGKPEPLKGNMSKYWSRRIDDEHRLVYQFFDNSISIISMKYHY